MQNERLIRYKQTLNLRPNAMKLYDFVVEYLGLEDLSSNTPINNAMDPWFGVSNDRIRPDDYSQYLDSRLHQKYRIALEFCAIEAGLKSIVGYVPSKDRLRPATECRFWFFGRHPYPVRWILRGHGEQRNIIVAEGEEKQGSINIDTIEDWLTEHIDQFRKINNEQTGPVESTGA